MRCKSSSPAGSTGTTIQDRIKGRELVSYRVDADAGQTMTVSLFPSNSATYFNVYAPGKGPGDEALAVSDITGPMVPDLNRVDAVLPIKGTYTVSVYLYRSAARRNESSDYTLEINIEPTGASSRTAPESDFADGLSGGPDFWEVTGVAAGDTLNMRAGPSTKDQVVRSFANGFVLRNKGCEMHSGQRWCRVETADVPSVRGWVAGRFLKEASGPAAGQGGDALVPGTNYNATGNIPCSTYENAPMNQCGFGVVRTGGGSGILTVELPQGGQRSIRFEGGVPVSSDAPGGVTSERSGDLQRVFIGTNERYEVVDAILFGG